MTDDLLALAPLIGLTVNTLVLLILVRRQRRWGLLRCEYLGFAGGAASVAIISLSALIQGGDTSRVIYHSLLGSLSYAALGYCHFHFVNLGETARRIRLLRELDEAGGELAHDQLLARYGAREITAKRIARLLNSGQIVQREDRYFIAETTVLKIARTMRNAKLLLVGKESEHV